MPEFRLVRKDNKAEIADMLVNNGSIQEGFHIEDSYKSNRECPFMREMNKAFGYCIQWHGLCQFVSTLVEKNIVPIKITDMRPIARLDNLWAFRNGNNLGSHNYAIYDADNDQFHFRQTIMDTLRFIQIYRLPREDLPLMIGREMCKLNTEFFEHKLKGGC